MNSLMTSWLPLYLAGCGDEVRPPDPFSAPDVAEQFSENPIDIQFPEATYTVFPGTGAPNSIYTTLSYCRTNFGNGGIFTSDRLDACLRSVGASLAESGLPELLPVLAERTVYIAQDSVKEYHTLQEALASAPALDLAATSTDNSTDVSERLADYMKAHRVRQPPNFCNTYRAIYGAPLLDYPRGLDPLHIPVDPTYIVSPVLSFEGPFPMPLLRLVIHGEETERDVIGYAYFEPSSNAVHAIEPERIRPAYSLVEKFRADIDQAAVLLHRHHPHIRERNFLAFLNARMATELTALDYEDPWQDRGGCDFSGCGLGFSRHLAGWEIGILRGDTVYEPSWDWGSLLVMDRKRQGFGPMQVILGLALEAASFPGVLEHYRGVLSAEDFRDERAALKTILENPVFSYALCLDYVLLRLESTVFSDPVVRTPRVSRPFIQDPAASREYALLHAAALLVAYPEQDVGIKEDVHAGVPGAAYEYIWGDVFGTVPEYATLRVLRQPQAAIEHLGGQRLVFYVVTGEMTDGGSLQR